MQATNTSKEKVDEAHKEIKQEPEFSAIGQPTIKPKGPVPYYPALDDAPEHQRALRSFTHFWLGYFDIGNRTARFDFWVPTIIMIITILLLKKNGNQTVFLIGQAVFYAAVMPQLTIIVRRLRDAGLPPIIALLYLLAPTSLMVLILCMLPSGFGQKWLAWMKLENLNPFKWVAVLKDKANQSQSHTPFGDRRYQAIRPSWNMSSKTIPSEQSGASESNQASQLAYPVEPETAQASAYMNQKTAYIWSGAEMPDMIFNALARPTEGYFMADGRIALLTDYAKDNDLKPEGVLLQLSAQELGMVLAQWDGKRSHFTVYC